MFHTLLFGLIVIPRTHKIVKILQQRHNIDIIEDTKTVEFVMGMTMASPLNNEEIAKEVVERYVFNKKEIPTNK
jgi:hypothetical protein